MSYKKYINYSLKGIMMGSLVVGSFLQMDEKVAKAVEEGETPTFEEDGIIYITPEATKEAGQKIFSDPNWITGLDNHATQQEVQQIQKLSANQYKDYDSNAYWAKDMKWAIDQGLITGYQNQKHPSQPAKGVGNWIDPSGNLTEYQMLNVMLRYKDGANFESAKTTMKDKTASNFAYVEYHFAKEYGIMTKGSTTNATPAKQQVTRGQMAQSLVSMHYGKKVTLQQAVDFMYANKLSTGVNASKGQTLENFGANTKLSRAHIVAFMGRYNDVVKSGSVKDTLNTGTSVGGIETPTPPVVNGGSSENPAPPSFEHTKYDYSNLHGKFDTSKKFTQNGIKISYKNHTYNTKSQSEYDQVMDYVNNTLRGKTYKDVKLDQVDLDYDLQVLERLMNGELKIINDRTDPAYRSKENMTARRYNTSYEAAINQGVSFETLSKFIASSQYASHFTGSASTAWGPPESAYDFFIKNEVDCTSWSYGRQAIYDALGYNTAVVHSPGANHDYLIIELDGKWFSYESSLESFNKTSVHSGDFIKFAPAQQVSELSFINIK
ncbi:S-layer homology domain-containing protein [Lysinibacillus capsici]|uniref:S-layer homology domain-containing protein n=1 Tax=Lysinibacillus capsici TaxID=2115968 RepID=UPI001C0FDF5D|nr:S-layer homology domain-containing protein [Lysinibacillus capsici]MBU5253462.1 S-layer homology domain-containing protein [Lysinibacillus capsici]